MSQIKTLICEGWPEQNTQLNSELKFYFGFREDITAQDGLVFKGQRVIVPVSLRNGIIERLHESHIGIQGCIRRAQECVYWPGITKDIEKAISQCRISESFANKQQKEPLISHEVPTRPWEKVGCDLCTFEGTEYLVTVDYFSNFIVIDRLSSTKGRDVIPKLKGHFARYGIPEEMYSDNGPPFQSKEFESFTLKYNIEQVLPIILSQMAK